MTDLRGQAHQLGRLVSSTGSQLLVARGGKAISSGEGGRWEERAAGEHEEASTGTLWVPDPWGHLPTAPASETQCWRNMLKGARAAQLQVRTRSLSAQPRETNTREVSTRK